MAERAGFLRGLAQAACSRHVRTGMGQLGSKRVEVRASAASAQVQLAREEVLGRPTRVRYGVLGITFAIAFVMYIDRAVVGAATPWIMAEFGLDKIAMGWTASAFNWSYALLQIPGGWLADRFGSRLILGAAIAWWSMFTSATGFARGTFSLALTRGLFGTGEAAAFPASSRALVPWLPQEQRAFGQGFQHAGARLGGAVAPALVLTMMTWFSWRMVFHLLGALGIVWAIVWYAYYRNLPEEHPWTNRAERELLPTAPARSRRNVPWRILLRSRSIWLLSLMYFCYGFVLWVYLQWLPTYLVEARHFKTEVKLGFAASLPLLAATLANPVGGWISDRLARSWGTRKGRAAVSIFGFAVAAVALVPGVLVDSASIAMLCLIIALAGLELTVAVSWALCIDIGNYYSGSVSGIMNTFGNIGGALSAVVVGYLATLYGWSQPFIVASALCVLAAACALRIDPSLSTADARS
ncbi:MAG TPA: MFS transporter [Terriglobales bacterium]|nr:MFS transporter [Terriglobales bacterium]